MTSHNDISSTWCIAHYAQEIANLHFEEFDKTPSIPLMPQKYHLDNVDSSKVALFHGDEDIYNNDKNMKRLIDALQSNNRKLLQDYKVPCANWTHTDYLKAVDQGKCINSRVLQLLNRVTGSSTATNIHIKSKQVNINEINFYFNF